MTSLPTFDLITAPCLREGPLVEAGGSFVAAARALGQTREASIIRAWCVAHIFQRRESVFASGHEPVAAFRSLLEETACLLRQMSRSNFARLGADIADGDASGFDSVEAVTGEHYGHLFKSFSSRSYWDEPAGLLRTRLERNGVDTLSIQGKSLLDAGCGGGRYTVAWHGLGARPAVGVDVSSIGIADARGRVREAGLDDIRFGVANTLSLPFQNDSFDMVFSNGALHHTRDWSKGVEELVRVLKPGGWGWLYLIEEPGGLFWASIEILRVVMQDERRDLARLALQILGIPANRIFYMLDHVLVPINIRLTPAEVEHSLSAGGATQLRRLTRGADFDRIERLYQGERFAESKYGVGENRYVFSKG